VSALRNSWHTRPRIEVCSVFYFGLVASLTVAGRSASRGHGGEKRKKLTPVNRNFFIGNSETRPYDRLRQIYRINDLKGRHLK
jgi:hypothetical protein